MADTQRTDWNHRIIRFKWVNYTVCELYLKKVVGKPTATPAQARKLLGKRALYTAYS